MEKTERVARDIATVRRGALVLGIGGVDVRDSEGLKAAADRCVSKLGSIDYAMYTSIQLHSIDSFSSQLSCPA